MIEHVGVSTKSARLDKTGGQPLPADLDIWPGHPMGPDTAEFPYIKLRYRIAGRHGDVKTKMSDLRFGGEKP
jgi:hypothetical protein